MSASDLGKALKQRRVDPAPPDEQEFVEAAYGRLFSPDKKIIRFPRRRKELPLDKLLPFFSAKIRFHLLAPPALERFAQELQRDGLLVPIIVRPVPGTDQYEILSGHNRVAAFKLLGYTSIIADIEEADDERALAIATATNLYRRSDYAPCELGWALRSLVEAKAHQGYRSDLVQGDGTSVRVGQKLEDARKEVAAAFGMSPTNTWRFIRLTFLSEELQDAVDQKRLAIDSGVVISQYDADSQERLRSVWASLNHKMPPRVASYIKEHCPPPSATIPQITTAWNAAEADWKQAQWEKSKISFDRKPLEPYLKKLGGEQALQGLFLEFLKERVG